MTAGRAVMTILALGFGGAGGDFGKSRYDLPIFRDVDQRNPELRAYLAWDLGGR